LHNVADEESKYRQGIGEDESERKTRYGPDMAGGLRAGWRDSGEYRTKGGAIYAGASTAQITIGTISRLGI
jgi:hypothetical protein